MLVIIKQYPQRGWPLMIGSVVYYVRHDVSVGTAERWGVVADAVVAVRIFVVILGFGRNQF